jgi:hypothetical protein
MSDKRLKAYQVDHYEGPEEGSVIVFAASNAPARRMGANELDLDWDSVESCRRAPHFDRYAPGPVPVEAMIEAGWRFSCDRWECQQPIAHDHINDDGDEVDTAGSYIVRGRQVFCAPECLARHDASMRSRQAAKDALIELVEAKFPGAQVVRVHVFHDRLVSVAEERGKSCATFRFPGAQHLSTYHFGEGSTAWVPQIDIPAFEALYRLQEAEKQAA